MKSAPPVFWTTQEEVRLRALYPDTPMPALLAVFGRSRTAITTRARVLGIKRSAAFLSGEHSGRLCPGHGRGRATQFKAKARTA